jgi:hypothetical protein
MRNGGAAIVAGRLGHGSKRLYHQLSPVLVYHAESVNCLVRRIARSVVFQLDKLSANQRFEV